MLRVCFYINFKLRADVDGDINSGDPSSYYKCCCCRRRRRAVYTLTRQEQWIIFSACYSSLSISGAIVKKCRRGEHSVTPRISPRYNNIIIIISQPAPALDTGIMLLSSSSSWRPVYVCYYDSRIVIIVFYSFVRFNNIMRDRQIALIT